MNEPILCVYAPSLPLHINAISLEILPSIFGKFCHISQGSAQVQPSLILHSSHQKMCPLIWLWNWGGHQCWGAIDCLRHLDWSKLAEGTRSLYLELVLIVIMNTPSDSHYETNFGNSDLLIHSIYRRDN